MKRNGFSLVEIIIVVAVLGIITVVGFAMLNTTAETRLVKCSADIMAMRTIVEQAREQTRRTPTRDEVMAVADGRWNDDYWYTWDNQDANSGHGNDLDFCDEDNPSGKLSHVKGVCYDIDWIIVCKHDHSSAEGGYVAVLEAANLPLGPVVFGGNPDHEFIKDLTFWSEISSGKDPNLQKWIGR